MDNNLSSIVVLIPAYKPGEALTNLSKELIERGFNQVVIVDDGSGDEYAAIFETLDGIGCRVLKQNVNGGKGRALKTGFEDMMNMDTGIEGVVTADADGQHLVRDIVCVAQMMTEWQNTIVLGSRAFCGEVPLKSRMGNAITRSVFNFLSGQRIRDTQTGLRGLPFSALPDLLNLPGDRYEYEMNMLLEASRLCLKLKEIDIETVYINNNSGSHFNPLKDSWRIYKRILMFGASSMMAFLIDFAVFTLMSLWVMPSVAGLSADAKLMEVIFAAVPARIISSLINFLVNRNVIFSKKKKDRLARHLLGYYLLVAGILTVNILMITALQLLGLNVLLAKVITEAILFFVSFFIQRRVIFK
jgi:glycosyltransferase involved in cell wall biosynthesis